MKEYRYQAMEEEQDSAFEDDSVKQDKYPSTFEELKYFIQNEDIPDIGVFGLHVGEDSRKTGEAGIFEDNGEYVVYQNGYDGHKDILYRGPNEAFAVKQFSVLFMKEKEAYLKIYKGYEEKKKIEKKEKAKRKFPKKTIAIIGVALVLLLAATGIRNSDPTPSVAEPDQHEYYTDADGNLYHLLRYWDDSFEIQYIWCVLEKDAEEWKVYDENLSESSFPEGVGAEDTIYPDASDYKCSERELDFYDSKIYIDYNNSEPYDSGYYWIGGELYYYVYNKLDRYYGETATCKQGWYHHDKETNTWEYLGTHNELKEINEDLWYYYDYCEYYFDLYEKDFDADHQPTRFEDTDYYENFLKDMELYDRKNGE